MNRRERYSKVLEWFKKNVPAAETELKYDSPFGLIVAVILSAQCTDKRVNLVTPDLLKAYPDAESMAKATPEDILPYISSVTFPNNKSRHLAAMARELAVRFKSVVPDDPDELQRLPGVGRKTANVIRGNIYEEPSIVVDTHVKRISVRLGFSDSSDPVRIEQDLMKILPKENWIRYNIQIIFLGRTICKAPTPKCSECYLRDICPSSQDKL